MRVKANWIFAALLASGLAMMGAAAVASNGPKNLKVLPKSTSKDAIKKTMKEISQALGVQCDHCHDTDDFAADTKMKNVARDMMRMTNDVNKKYFKGQARVKCVTCHAGAAEPKK